MYWRGNPVALTANGQTSQISCENFSSVGVQIYGTYSTVNLTFEVSNGENIWDAVSAVQTSANTVATTTGNLTNTSRTYRISTAPFAAIRVRVTAFTSGTMNVIWSGSDSGEPVGAVQTHAVTGSGTFTTAPAAGTNLIGDVSEGVRTTATNAVSATHLVAAASTNATVAKASAGRVYGWSFINTNAAIRYVKLHNIATTPTAGTGVVRTIGIPANGVSNFYTPHGHSFATGISFTTVTGSADADTTGVGAGDIVGELFYA
jgi:hypothetical protein